MLGIGKILDSAKDTNITLWLRVSMVVAPIILIGAAYLVIRKKVKIDEEYYKHMLTEIEARKDETAEPEK